MRWIDFDGKKPTDPDIPNWQPWTAQQWQNWEAESRRLVQKLGVLNDERLAHERAGEGDEAAAKLAERNKFIDDNSEHWAKLKPWLSALSNGKCWFTEAQDLASHMDVEHFRPKKIAKNRDGSERDGYWWLAFDYTNYRFAGNAPNRMKGGWFPLHPDSRCSRHDARCEESEEFTLLDPVVQLDADLLAFDESGDAILAPGKTDPWEAERVTESILRYKLNEHDVLPAARRAIWKKVDAAIQAYLTAKRAHRPGINPVPRETLKEKARLLREMTQPGVPLSSAALWCVRLHKDLPANPELLRLVA